MRVINERLEALKIQVEDMDHKIDMLKASIAYQKEVLDSQLRSQIEHLKEMTVKKKEAIDGRSGHMIPKLLAKRTQLQRQKEDLERNNPNRDLDLSVIENWKHVKWGGKELSQEELDKLSFEDLADYYRKRAQES